MYVNNKIRRTNANGFFYYFHLWSCTTTPCGSLSLHVQSQRPHDPSPPHLARLLLHRRLTVTIFTTLTNRPFISESLKDTTASNLPFSHNMLDIPVAIDTTENLPSMSLFHSFANATNDMQPDFEQALHTLPRVGFMVSDAFLWWTQDSASKFNIPRLVYYGMSYYS